MGTKKWDSRPPMPRSLANLIQSTFKGHLIAHSWILSSNPFLLTGLTLETWYLACYLSVLSDSSKQSTEQQKFTVPSNAKANGIPNDFVKVCTAEYIFSYILHGRWFIKLIPGMNNSCSKYSILMLFSTVSNSPDDYDSSSSVAVCGKV